MMIDMTTRTIALDALQYLGKRDQRKARAVYLRYMKDCKYHEIAQELHCSISRARQLSESGKVKISKYLSLKYGQSLELDA
jgi:DNA-directed RNA polymerase specialized sigma24 family protein